MAVTSATVYSEDTDKADGTTTAHDTNTPAGTPLAVTDGQGTPRFQPLSNDGHNKIRADQTDEVILYRPGMTPAEAATVNAQVFGKSVTPDEVYYVNEGGVISSPSGNPSWVGGDTAPPPSPNGFGNDPSGGNGGGGNDNNPDFFEGF